MATAYSSFPQYQEGPNESVFCARPTLKDVPVSSWGTRKRNYDTKAFAAAVATFMKAAPAMKHNAAYEIDAIDFQRQVNANRGEEIYADMVAAFTKKIWLLLNKLPAAFCRSCNNRICYSMAINISGWIPG